MKDFSVAVHVLSNLKDCFILTLYAHSFTYFLRDLMHYAVMHCNLKNADCVVICHVIIFLR